MSTHHLLLNPRMANARLHCEMSCFLERSKILPFHRTHLLAPMPATIIPKSAAMHASEKEMSCFPDEHRCPEWMPGRSCCNCNIPISNRYRSVSVSFWWCAKVAEPFSSHPNEVTNLLGEHMHLLIGEVTNLTKQLRFGTKPDCLQRWGHCTAPLQCYLTDSGC